MWTAWTVRTRTIGDPDLRLKLLVGSEATHYTNVPCVVEVSGDYFPLSHDDTTDHDTILNKTHLNSYLEGLKKSETDRKHVISDLQGTNNRDLYEINDISEIQRTITTPHFGHKVNNQFGNRVISELLPVKYYPSTCHYSISGSRTNSKKITKKRNLRYFKDFGVPEQLEKFENWQKTSTDATEDLKGASNSDLYKDNDISETQRTVDLIKSGESFVSEDNINQIYQPV